MAVTDTQTYLRAAGKAAESLLTEDTTLTDTHIAKLSELRRYEAELKQQAKALREAIDYAATDALTEGMTYAEVAKALGLTKQRIAQRYAKPEGRHLRAAEFLRTTNIEASY